MNTNIQVSQLQETILSGAAKNWQNAVDQLIELEGMDAMAFFQSIFYLDPRDLEEKKAAIREAAGYGVRRLMELRASSSGSDFRYCPYCASGLSIAPLIDPYLIGFTCANGHCFHCEVKQGEPTKQGFKIPSGKPVEMAKECLANKTLREFIPNQVAEILRKYIDLVEADITLKEDDPEVHFCPICSKSLQEFPQDDVWVKGLSCSNKHILYERNGLTYNLATLEPDMTKALFNFHLNGWLRKI